jgi:hypothetical protein
LVGGDRLNISAPHESGGYVLERRQIHAQVVAEPHTQIVPIFLYIERGRRREGGRGREREREKR